MNNKCIDVVGKGTEHTIYAVLGEPPLPSRMCITKAGTTEMELGWVNVPRDCYRAVIGINVEDEICMYSDFKKADDFAEHMLGRKHEAAMVS